MHRKPPKCVSRLSSPCLLPPRLSRQHEIMMEYVVFCCYFRLTHLFTYYPQLTRCIKEAEACAKSCGGNELCLRGCPRSCPSPHEARSPQQEQEDPMSVRLLLLFLSPRTILLTDHLQHQSCDGLKFTRCSNACKTGDRKCRAKCYHDNCGSGFAARAQEDEVKRLQARGWDASKYGTCIKKCKVGDSKCHADCYLKFDRIDISARAPKAEAKLPKEVRCVPSLPSIRSLVYSL